MSINDDKKNRPFLGGEGGVELAAASLIGAYEDFFACCISMFLAYESNNLFARGVIMEIILMTARWADYVTHPDFATKIVVAAVARVRRNVKQFLNECPRRKRVAGVAFRAFDEVATNEIEASLEQYC
ncbi:MAG: hypothetical protein KBC02_01130 [Candidatus Pacebacteria bacterium]|nr:hypothetical protein [Candidatus Paceibacterota bacterium]